MSDVQKTGYRLPLIDLTRDNASSSNHTARDISFTERDNRGTNQSPDIIDLTNDDNQHVTSNIPVIDLTGDNGHFLNYRIPVIDLTDDDVQDISNQIQCIDDDASSSNHTIQNFDLGEIDDRSINRSTKRTDLTFDDIQDFNPNTSAINLTCDEDQFLNSRIRCTDTTNDVQDICHQLQNFVLTDGTQQIRNDCIPKIDLKNHSTDQIIPVTDLTIEKDCNNDRRQIIDSIRSDGRVIRKHVDDGTEMYDLSCNNSHTSFLKGVIENNLRIPAANLNYIATENDFSKCKETANMNVMHTDTFSNMQKFHRRKENLANTLKHFEYRKEANLTNHPLKDFECRKEVRFTNNRLRKNYEEKIEMNLTNHPLRNNFEDRKENIWTNNPLTSSSEEKYSRRRKSEEISLKNAGDFMKPARRPIPLRHSLGRSTVNTSKNVPIECTDASEDESRILTVSSIIRRRKSKSVTDISKTDLPKSKELSTSRENTFSFETLNRNFMKIWIFLLLTFIGLYYWL